MPPFTPWEMKVDKCDNKTRSGHWSLFAFVAVHYIQMHMCLQIDSKVRSEYLLYSSMSIDL